MAINADINGVIAKTVGNRIAFACGTTTPAAGSVGHEHGALFLNQNDGLYVNVGDQASCDFRAVVTNNPDTAYGVIDCVATLGMQGGVADADENSTKLQDSLTADAYPYPYQVSGMFRLGTTVNVDRTAHKFAGTGMHRSSATSSVGTLYGTPSGFISHLTCFAFNGTTVTAASSGGSDTITISGHAVSSDDVGLTLRITGGVNFITGVYVVESVGADTWTLDRTCTSDAASGLTGSVGGVLIKDRAFGSVYEGLYFSGLPLASNSRAATTAPRASALLQFTTEYNTVNPAKAHVRDCMFTDADVGILLGTGMYQAWEESLTYAGNTDLFADTLTATHLFFHGIGTCIYARTEQSVSHTLRGIQAINFNELIYFERGGEVTVEEVMMGGTKGTMLRIGKLDSNGGRIAINGFGFDASGDATNMKLLAMDETGGTVHNVFGRIDIANGLIDSGIGAYNVPIIEAKGGWRVHIRNVERIRPESLLLSPGTDGYRPYVVFDGCYFQGLSVDNNRDEQQEIINSDSGATYVVKFRNCSDANNSVVYDDLDIVDGVLIDPHA